VWPLPILADRNVPGALHFFWSTSPQYAEPLAGADATGAVKSGRGELAVACQPIRTSSVSCLSSPGAPTTPKKRPKFRPDCHGLSWTVADNSTVFDLLTWTVKDSHGPVRTTDTRLRIKRFGVRAPASALNDERLRKGPLIFIFGRFSAAYRCGRRCLSIQVNKR
jgi:hypothetical protein